jgi:hypothetical protein
MNNVEVRDWLILVLIVVVTFLLLGLQSCATLAPPALKQGDMSACLKYVPERGSPPPLVVEDIVKWVHSASPEYFEPNDSKMDIYNSVLPQLGPYTSITHRRAVMAESLIILAARESSWDWNEGRDRSASNTSNETMESGIFQTSCNARSLKPVSDSLKAIMAAHGITTCRQFITDTKSNHTFALEFTAKLLRFRTDHHGPVLRKEINPYLRRACVAAIELRL